MRFHIKEPDGLEHKGELPFDDWNEAVAYIQHLFDNKTDAAIMEQRNYEDGRKSACIKDRTGKIMYQLKTLQ